MATGATSAWAARPKPRWRQSFPWPHTQQEIAASLATEVEQERFTSIDRALMREANEEGVIIVTKADNGQKLPSTLDPTNTLS